jgi:TM2 domain-containing membrane protein YozV
MKKIGLLFGFILLATSVSFASVDQYKIDDKQVDAMFANAVEMSFSDLTPLNLDYGTEFYNTFEIEAEKNPVVAFALCWVLGYLGVHRMYLGSSVGTYILYIITGGGCGIVVTVDWVMLLIALIDNKDIGKYVDNPKFIMW